VGVQAGPFGGHKPAEKTIDLILRVAWWPSMDERVRYWVDRCWTCLRLRKQVMKCPVGFMVPSAVFPWHHVIIDIEGPSSPRTLNRSTHVFEYIDVLSHGVVYEPLSGLSHRQVRRALTRCICRVQVVPGLVGLDRGPEMWNTLMREFAAILQTQLRPGAPYRPVEQAPIEREHVELRRLEGGFVHDVCQVGPNLASGARAPVLADCGRPAAFSVACCHALYSFLPSGTLYQWCYAFS
jgi:hypothetical protein